jgi:acyl-CoA reductase-like NAD-dependent aldehyde dehydrogenase
VLDIPAYRFGKAYESLDLDEIKDFRTGEVCARIGKVNAGLIRRDLRKLPAAFASFQEKQTDEMLDVCARAADLFEESDLEVAEGCAQSPGQYADLVMHTGGLPRALVLQNIKKISGVLREMPAVLRGLTRGLDLRVLDDGVCDADGLLTSYRPVTTHLAVVLPSNSPGVNALWLPAIAMRIPVLLKPGSGDPWTPLRIMAALFEAGCPRDVMGYYPTDHEGAGVIASDCERVMSFGDATTVARHAGNPRVSVHGPGYSKILIGSDAVGDWEKHLDVLVTSVAANSGRSCINASTIVVPEKGREIGEAIAKRLAEIQPLPLDDDAAVLAGFMNSAFADAIDAGLDKQLEVPGAVDLSDSVREGERSTDVDGVRYLQPTVVNCSDPEHPLARSEFLFPFVAIVEVPDDEMISWIGPTLVCSVISDNAALQRGALASANIDRLNLGPIPTTSVQWDQPHEGNLFEFLYQRRGIQVV